MSSSETIVQKGVLNFFKPFFKLLEIPIFFLLLITFILLSCNLILFITFRVSSVELLFNIKKEILEILLLINFFNVFLNFFGLLHVGIKTVNKTSLLITFLKYKRSSYI